MKKVELVKALKENGVIETLAQGEELFETIDKVIEIATSIEGKTKIGQYFTVEKIDVPKKEGVCNGKPYVKEAHSELQIKRTATCKEYK